MLLAVISFVYLWLMEQVSKINILLLSLLGGHFQPVQLFQLQFNNCVRLQGKTSGFLHSKFSLNTHAMENILIYICIVEIKLML